MTISRTYTFADGTPLAPSKVEVEISNLVNSLNGFISGTVAFSGLVFIAPDGRRFTISIIYDTDGVTPLLQITG